MDKSSAHALSLFDKEKFNLFTSVAPIYDVVIIGAGPAGLTAGIYAARADLSTLLIERFGAGGQILNTYEVDNYPGLPEIGGMELGDKFEEHAKKYAELPFEHKLFFTVHDWPVKKWDGLIRVRQRTGEDFVTTSHEPFVGSKYIDITGLINSL